MFARSFLALAALGLVATYSAPARADDATSYKEGLLSIKQALLNADVRTALAIVDKLLALDSASAPTPPALPPHTFAATKAQYWSYGSVQSVPPECSEEDKSRIEAAAQAAAIAKCQAAGLAGCALLSDGITKSGALDPVKDIGLARDEALEAFYAGCVATALVHGN